MLSLEIVLHWKLAIASRSFDDGNENLFISTENMMKSRQTLSDHNNSTRATEPSSGTRLRKYLR